MKMNPTIQEKADEAIKEAEAQWGKGWEHLSPELRAGAVCMRIVALVLGQNKETASPAVRELQAICVAAMDRFPR